MYSSDSSAGLRKDQERRDSDIRAAQKAVELQFSGFDDKFYNARKKAYLGFALPQLAEQYQAAQSDLLYSLAGKGLLKSGAAGTLSAGLQKELHKQKQVVADTATEQANTLRKDVEGQQSSLLTQAFSALDPGATVIAAKKSAASFSEPSTFAPVGQLFRDWTNLYATKRISDAYAQNEPLTFGTGTTKVAREVRS